MMSVIFHRYMYKCVYNGCLLLDITVGFVLTEDSIPESQGYGEVCTRLYNVVPSGTDLNLTVSLGFSQGKPSTECKWEQIQLSKGGCLHSTFVCMAQCC